MAVILGEVELIVGFAVALIEGGGEVGLEKEVEVEAEEDEEDEVEEVETELGAEEDVDGGSAGEVAVGDFSVPVPVTFVVALVAAALYFA